MPDPVAHEFDGVRSVLVTIANNLRKPPQEIDISHVMSAVQQLLDRSVASEPYVIEPGGGKTLDGPAKVDLSQFDFEALKKLIRGGKQRTVIEKLRAALEKRINEDVRLNRTRMDYLERFQRMIAEYNSGAKNMEDFFRELRDLVSELDEEERRAVREGLSEEELALFDILTKPEMKLTRKDRDAVKKVSRELLDRLKEEKLVLDWRQRQQTRADVRLTIETMLDQLPRAFDEDIWQQKCNRVYQHVFDSYAGAGRGVYEDVA